MSAEEEKRLTAAVIAAADEVPQARIELDLALERLILKEQKHAVAVEQLQQFRRRQALQ